VKGRNAISWEEKFNLDLKYVENLSFILDMRIIFLTIKKVVLREDINASNLITMESFRGFSR
jgi:lipopolysaccharide/colanic/teichoic acid biosynthesis glycosyltransferase